MSRRRESMKDLKLKGTAEVALLSSHLQRLAATPSHGNRILTVDRLFLALLLAFYNPMVRSLRLLEDCGDLNGQIDLPKLARSTTADALAACDPALLEPVIADLRQRAFAKDQDDQDLLQITRRIIAADGTYLTTLANVAWALKHTKSNGKKQGQVRLNVQLDVQTWCPQVLSVSGDDEQSEPQAFIKDLQSDVLYVVDRNFLNFAFLKALQKKHNDLVLRLKSGAPSYQVIENRKFSVEDHAAGVIGDQVIQLTGRDAPEGAYRLVIVQVPTRDGEETFRLLTTLTCKQIAPAIIAEIYRQRWQIELFFKWLKTVARMNHLLSTTRNGITFQFYVAIIAVLLMYVQLGKRVSRYAFNALNLFRNGQISFEQMLAIIARREREKTLAAQAAQRRKEKLNAAGSQNSPR